MIGRPIAAILDSLPILSKEDGLYHVAMIGRKTIKLTYLLQKYRMIEVLCDKLSYFFHAGLDGAGKTTALYRLKFDQYINTVPTIGKRVTDCPVTFRAMSKDDSGINAESLLETVLKCKVNFYFLPSWFQIQIPQRIPVNISMWRVITFRFISYFWNILNKNWWAICLSCI